MGIVLGPNQYGKAETRVVRVVRDTARHEIHDLNVSTALRGDFSAAHLAGDQADVLPTDTQKNTVYAFARSRGVGAVETFGLDLARHFVDDVAPVLGARVELEEYTWARAAVGGVEHEHAFVRDNRATRTAVVTVDGEGDGQRGWVVSGIKDLVLLKTTGSEFHGFLTDEYTTLVPTTDRIMATSLVARWRSGLPAGGLDALAGHDWDAQYADVSRILVEQFATLHSLALQQTLWAMGSAVLTEHPDIAEIKLSAPNRHHFVVDLSPFDLDNPNLVFHADDRPYGLIQATVTREEAPDAGLAWYTVPGFA